MKTYLVPFFISLSILSANAQFTITNLGDGLHQMNSAYVDTDMHFYLFGDGYHSFESNPTHQFNDNYASYDVVAYHSDPYDGGEPPQETVGTTGSVTDNPTNPGPATMSNMVQVKRSWNLVEGNKNYFLVMIENNSSSTPQSGCLEFHFSTGDTYIETSNIDDAKNGWFSNRTYDVSEYENFGYSNKYVWDFDNLSFGEQRYIYVKAECLLPAYSYVKTAAVMKLTNDCSDYVALPGGGEGEGGGNGSNGGNGSYPAYVLNSQVSAFPFDPNCIISRCNYLDDYSDERTIPYWIYFQNDGVDPVKDVRVEYFTSAVVKSINLISASNDVVLRWDKHSTVGTNHNPIAEFRFDDIFLMGSNQDPAPDPDKNETAVGWVYFEVCYDLEFVAECLTNRIDIYFNDLDPVIARSKYVEKEQTILLYCVAMLIAQKD